MLSAPESRLARALRLRATAVVVLSAFGFAFTLYVFFPGIMTLDARYVYNDIAKNFLGDWQSPVMTLLWSLIDPIAPGPASMFLFIAALYWAAFGMLAVKLARRSVLALILPILALTPPAFVLVGVIWRDVLFAALWLLAAALVFDTDARELRRRWPQALALALVVFGVLIRPNAVLAAPILAAYVFWPARWSPRRTLILYFPAFIAFVALVPLIYYAILGAVRQHPLHGLLIFDLGGITHFAKQNQFPVAWSPRQTELLVSGCYRPDKWDIYWYLEPCRFVMQRLEGDKIFGTPAITSAWRRAILRHPTAYLRHRAAFMGNFLTGSNLVMWTADIDRPGQTVFAGRPPFMVLLKIHDWLKPTWLFKPASWLLLCVALCFVVWRRRETPYGAFVLATCGSGAIYVASYLVVGVASDYRYAYFAVLAALAGATVLLAQLFEDRRIPAAAARD